MAGVKAELREGTAVTLRTRQFTWKGDEPESAGGTDTGPDPYELLMGALGACIAATLRIYADHKGIELTGVDVELAFDRIRGDDIANSEHPTDGRIECITSHVTLHGDFDDAQRARLTQVAQRCPVHKTLVSGLTVEDSVDFG